MATEPTSLNPTSAAATATSPPIVPAAVLDNLSARFRPAGLLVVLLRPDGTLAYCDPLAAPFFQKFVRPQLDGPAALGESGSGSALVERIRQTTATSTVASWNILPGIEIAALPHVDRRQLQGIFLLAGKASGFRLGEDVVRACGRLALDGIWLGQQADELPSHDAGSIQRQARLLLTMVRDQSRICSLESELDSLSGQLSNTYEELSLIYQISGGMKVNRGPADFFKQTCLELMEVLGVRAMGVALSGDRDGGMGMGEPTLWGNAAIGSATVRRLSDDLIRALRQRKGPLLCNDLAHDKSLRWFAEHARQLIAVPLQLTADEVSGCIFGIDKHHSEFDSVDAKLLTSIASQSSIYLENARLFDDVHGLMMGLLHALTSAVDAKDAYTCGHSERVALLSRQLSRQAGLAELQVDRIYMAGLLHDVGKIGVPESVLQKAGRLTPEEFEQMKRHPAIGARILADIRQVADIIPGVLHHHERYDGRGYPSGLAGKDIPMMGRIICVADCFDAMTSNRTYRRALPLEVALGEIRRCSGTQFDPGLAEAFLQIGAETLRELLNEHRTQAQQRLDLQRSLRAA